MSDRHWDALFIRLMVSIVLDFLSYLEDHVTLADPFALDGVVLALDILLDKLLQLAAALATAIGPIFSVLILLPHFLS